MLDQLQYCDEVIFTQAQEEERENKDGTTKNPKRSRAQTADGSTAYWYCTVPGTVPVQYQYCRNVTAERTLRALVLVDLL